MTPVTDIRKLYQPSQPTIRPNVGQVGYAEFLPDSRLLPFIYCYWELKTRKQASSLLSVAAALLPSSFSRQGQDMYLTIEVDDVDGLYRDLKAKGGTSRSTCVTSPGATGISPSKIRTVLE